MIPTQEIQELADRIAAQFHPERIILFGSYAWGHPTPDSDVDLLVVLPFQGKSWRMASEIRRHARASFPMDLLVRTPAQLRQRLADGDTFLEEVTRQGQVLYEA
jgi:uncharacterized protein